MRFPSVLALLLSWSCTDDVVDHGEVASALEAAPLDDAHPYAVGICQADDAASCVDGGNCTGSLIAPNLVLTARHCVDNGSAPSPQFCEGKFLGIVDKSTLRITTHPDPYGVGQQPTWYAVSKVWLSGDDKMCSGDLALVMLSQNIPAAEAQPVAVDIDGALAPSEVAIVGRGVIAMRMVKETFPQEHYKPQIDDTGNYQRRRLENIEVTCQPDSAGCTVEDVTDASGTFTAHASHFMIEPSAYPGDSGSGFVDQASFGAGAPVVVGVTTLGTWGAQGTATSVLGVAASKHAAFIRTTALAAADAGGYAVPAWVTESNVGDDDDDDNDDGDGGGCSATRGSAGAWPLLGSLGLLGFLGLVRRRRVTTTGR